MNSEASHVRDAAAYYVSDADVRVPPGYKRSKVGLIPEDWCAIDLSELCTLQRGFDLTEATRNPGSVPVYSSSGLSYFHDRALVGPPGVVTGRKGLLGKVFLIAEPFWPHDTTLWVKDFRGNEPAYVALVLENFRLERLDAATSVPTLNRNNLVGHLVPIPRPGEQRAIAEALSDVDGLLGALEALIAKKQAIKQAAMQQLLTGKTRLPGFSGEWKTARLADVSAFITKGSTPTTYGFEWQSSGILFLRSECASPQGLDLTQSMFISAKAHTVLRRSAVQAGDLLITITGNVGRVVRFPKHLGEANINQHIARIRIMDEATDPGWVFQVLSQSEMRRHFERITTGQAYPQISLTQVRDAVIPRPTLDEQQAISAALDDMDAEIDALEARRDKTRAIKQGMMQQLLTGRVRLVEPGEASAA